MTISVERDASAVLSTQASTKVYRSPRGTTSELMGRIEEGGTLLVLPDPVVCFAGARYCQRQRVRMSERASLVIADCMLSGRRAAGERWRFVDYRSLLEIIVGSRLLVHDSMALREADGELVRRFGRINALATVAIVGPHFCEHAARLVTWSAAQEVTPASELVITASNLSDQGCVVRIAGSSGENVWRSVKTVLNFIPPWLGDDPWARKW
jgi:urease accessory protein